MHAEQSTCKRSQQGGGGKQQALSKVHPSYRTPLTDFSMSTSTHTSTCALTGNLHTCSSGWQISLKTVIAPVTHRFAPPPRTMDTGIHTWTQKNRAHLKTTLPST
eukprot:55538-Pelagomonas_calceolata.AAC.1